MGDRKGLVSSAGKLVPLKEIDVSVTISGYVADIQSTSLYVNNEESPIEAIFTFPLDDQSAVYRFEADIDGRHLIAECHEKEKAKEIYDDAVSFGHTAMLLQEDESAGDIFRCRLGNLPSNAEAKISTGFATELDLEADGKVKFTLPAILNPRYSPGVGGLNPTEKARYATADAIPYKLNFQLLVRGPRKIKGIQGSKDKLNVDYLEDQRVAKVTLAEEFKFDHDLSVLVEYESCSLPQIVFEKGDPHSGGLLKEDVLMINFFLEPPAQLSRTNPGEFIFIIDRSGSMQGDKILNAKETLLLFLKSLPVNCYFNVIGFGSHFQSLFQEGSQKYNEENLRKAEELQKQMKADLGGTELLSPLEHVFKQKLIENYPRQLFVLTDGEISNTADVLKLAGTNSQHSRVFTVGIGQGASTALVRGLAKAGKGKEVFVTDSERLQPKVISLLQCAMQPVATDVEIVWELPSPVTWIMMPPKIPYLFLGVRQILYVMLSGTEGVDPSYECSMTLNGKLVSKPFEYKETFTFHGNTETGTSAPIHRLAAKAQVKDLQLNDAPKEQIVTVSKSANVISKHTAFVMVDSEGKLVEGIPMQRIIPTPSMGRMINRRAVPLMTYSMEASVWNAPQMPYDADCCLSAPSVLQSKSLGAPRGLKMTKRSSPSSNVSDVMDYEESHERFNKGGLMDFKESHKRSYKSDLMNLVVSHERFQEGGLMDFEESEEMSDTERMMDVIRLQTFQGSWSLDKKLVGMLKTDAEILKQTIPLQDDYVVATVAVIAWLRKHHSERRDEWQMLETKALDWLEGQGLHGHAVEDLISRLNI